MYLQQPHPEPEAGSLTGLVEGFRSRSESGQPRAVQVDGRTVAFTEFGASGGYPLLYCHQYGGSRLEARALEESAQRRGFRIVAVDRPGLGGSDFAGMEQADPVSDLLALADELGLGSYGVLAWGGGCGYALELAQRDPLRARFCMAFSCPSLLTNEDHPTQRSARGQRWLYSMVRKALRWRCRLVARWTAPTRKLDRLYTIAAPADRRLLRRGEVRRWLDDFLDEAARHGSRGLAQDVAGCFRICRFDPGSLDLPVELWYGASDRLMNDCGGRRLAARLPQGRYRRLSGAGHFFFLNHQDILFDRLVALAERGAPGREPVTQRVRRGVNRALVA